MADETGLRCPECGWDELLYVYKTSRHSVNKNGVSISYVADRAEVSRCECPECHHESLLTDFRPKPVAQMLLEVAERVKQRLDGDESWEEAYEELHRSDGILSMVDAALAAVKDRGLDG